MQELADVLLLLGIGLLSVLPAVYAIALQSLVTAAEIERRTSAAAVADFEEELAQIDTTGGVAHLGLDGVEDLERRIREVQADVDRVSRQSALLSARHAFFIPASLWVGAIAISSVARFADNPTLVKNGLLSVAVLAVAGGLLQLSWVLRAAQNFARQQVPDLQLSIRGESDPLVWEQNVQTDLFVHVFNAGAQVARSLQVEIRVPRSMFWHGNAPWFEPNAETGVIHTRSFDLKAYNTYSYGLGVTPREAGDFLIQLRAVSEEFYGTSVRQRVVVNP